MRPIDADRLENMGYELHRTYREDANTMVYEVKKITDVPTIEAEPVRLGMWNTIQGDIVVCSICGTSAPQIITGCFVNRHLEPNRTNYCPNCGAKMERNNE